MRSRILIVLMAAGILMLAMVAEATTLAIRPTDGSTNWYKSVPPTVTSEAELLDRSSYANQLYPILGETKVTGSTDLSVLGWICFNDDKILLHFEVTDDVITNLAGKSSSYLGDACELGFAQSDSDPNRVSFIVRPTSANNVYVYRPADGSAISLPSLVVSVSQTAKGWSFDGSFMAADAGLVADAGQQFRINVLVYDRDDVSAVGQDTILGIGSSGNVGYDDMSVWSDAAWIMAPEKPQDEFLTASVKKLSDSTLVNLVGAVVTVVSDRDKCFYIQGVCQNKMTGLRVNFPSNWNGVSKVKTGQIVDSIIGKIRIRRNQRELDAETVDGGYEGQLQVPGPLFINGKNLGGTDPFGLVPRVGGYGPSNVGLLAKVAGRVVEVRPTGDFVLACGEDVLVLYSGGFPPAVGTNVSVVGAITTNPNDSTKAAIQAKSDSLVAY